MGVPKGVSTTCCAVGGSEGPVVLAGGPWGPYDAHRRPTHSTNDELLSTAKAHAPVDEPLALRSLPACAVPSDATLAFQPPSGLPI